MPLKPRSDERARGDLPRKSLCAATDIVTIPEKLLIFPYINYRYPFTQGKRNYFWTYSRRAALSQSCGAAKRIYTCLVLLRKYHSTITIIRKVSRNQCIACNTQSNAMTDKRRFNVCHKRTAEKCPYARKGAKIGNERTPFT